MSAVKTPTSSLTAYEPLAYKIWYRTKAKIKRLFHRGTSKVSPQPPKVSTRPPEEPTRPPEELTLPPEEPTQPHEEFTQRPSPASRLPQEILEKIISHLIRDFPTLLACSRTCHSWYIATVPHLYYSLSTLGISRPGGYQPEVYRKLAWPQPLKKSYKLGLLPLVKRFRICQPYHEFTPTQLNGLTLRYFSALTNLRELGIDNLQVSSFMPTIRQCFGHLSPTLRFLALKNPNGTHRQILYFIGLLPNLQDLKLQYSKSMDEPEDTTDATLIPLSTPPLRGWLRLVRFKQKDLVKDMITLFGGLRFRHMDLSGVSCSQLLLNECAEALETLRLYPTDVYVDRSAPEGFDLSRNKSLRTLETTASSMFFSYDKGSSFLKATLSSVASPAPLEVVIIYQNEDFQSQTPCKLCAPQPSYDPNPYCEWFPPSDCFSLGYKSLFKVFQEMHSVKGFSLVLCLDVSDCIMMYALGELERVLRQEERSGRFDYLLDGPVVTRERRVLRTGPRIPDVLSMAAMPPFSAL